MSWCFLGKSSGATASLGAVLIVVGSCFSGFRSLLSPPPPPPPVAGSGSASLSSSSFSTQQQQQQQQQQQYYYWYSILMYAVAQIFMSGEKVWEDHAFQAFRRLDPMVMFAWT